MTEQAKTVTIDDVEYAWESLTENARAQLANLTAVDAEIARLNTRLAIARTARNAYALELRAALPTGEPQE